MWNLQKNNADILSSQKLLVNFTNRLITKKWQETHLIKSVIYKNNYAEILYTQKLQVNLYK